jgi:hypothetical protein
MSNTTPNQNGVAPSEAYPYDAFVSYADEDAEWCVDELIAPLEAGGVEVIHERKFTLGKTRIGSEDDAVRCSRHTIAFLTLAYLHAKWQGFLVDRVLSQALSSRPLIPVLAEDCELPLKLNGLVQLDFINPDGRKQAIQRLLENLGRSSQEAQKAAALTVTRGIRALARLMRYGLVQKAVAGYEASFQAAAREIMRIDRFKKLHDDFQTVEGSFKLVVDRRRRAAQVSTGDRPGTMANLDDELEEALDALTRDLDLLLESAQKSALPEDQIAWTRKIKRVGDRLKAAVIDQNVAEIAPPLEKLHRVLGNEPPELNKRIVEGVARLSLGEVAGSLRAVRDKLSLNSFDPDAQARFEEFAKSVVVLPELDRALLALHANHNWLQNIDVALQPLKGTRKPDPSAIAELWEDVIGPVSHLDPAVGADWVKELQLATDEVTKAVACPPIDPAGIRLLQRLFNQFRIEMDKTFNRADRDLLTLCGQLRKVGEALLQAIKEMQNG